MPAEPLDGVRKAELSRRAVRPAGDPKRGDGRKYERVLKGRKGGTMPPDETLAIPALYEKVFKGRKGGTSLPKPAEPMPPTYCRSIELRPETHQRDGQTVRCPRPHCPLIREPIRFRVHAHVLVHE